LSLSAKTHHWPAALSHHRTHSTTIPPSLNYPPLLLLPLLLQHVAKCDTTNSTYARASPFAHRSRLPNALFTAPLGSQARPCQRATGASPWTAALIAFPDQSSRAWHGPTSRASILADERARRKTYARKRLVLRLELVEALGDGAGKPVVDAECCCQRPPDLAQLLDALYATALEHSRQRPALRRVQLQPREKLRQLRA